MPSDSNLEIYASGPCQKTARVVLRAVMREQRSERPHLYGHRQFMGKARFRIKLGLWGGSDQGS